MATITQGDFSVFGFFETRESGRWGEGGAKDNSGTTTTFSGPTFPAVVTRFGKAATESGGSFDFNRWDLVEARQLADIRPDYHMVKNYKFLGRLDTLILKDADFFAFYRPWYDAFGSIKSGGRAEPNRGWDNYTQRELQQQYFRNDLREYYAQLNFTDNFSMRVGKQQIIWSEADALSGTEVTNSVDSTFHWVHFETPENLRKNIRMVKFNYILPDFLKTANNEAEFVWIPGDWQGDGFVVNSTDARNPWIAPLPLGPLTGYNEAGQPFRHQTIADNGNAAGGNPLLPTALGGGLFGFFQENVITRGRRPSNSIANNSEFAMRLSSLLPIGSGLQASFIYLFEARSDRLGLCTSCGNEFGIARTGPGTFARVKFAHVAPGVFIAPGVFDYGAPLNPATFGTIRVDLSTNYLRRHWFGLTGTYYDKELTDMVFRYDVLYAPKVGIAISNGLPGPAAGAGPGSGAAWTQQTRWILAADRPTYIPWISKQHTFLVFQYVNTWYPDRPSNAAPFFGDFAGRIREDSNFGFISAVNWLMNGQLTSTNTVAWDIDDTVGAVSSTNVYRYSRNVLLGLNAIWYLGRSGRYTDPFLESRGQRINELEATLSYEI